MQNKATIEFRETIQKLLDANQANVQKWLASVAKDDPAKALDMLAKLAEYAAPKLARTEHTGPGGGPLKSESTLTLAGLTDEQLRALASIPIPPG